MVYTRCYCVVLQPEFEPEIASLMQPLLLCTSHHMPEPGQRIALSGHLQVRAGVRRSMLWETRQGWFAVCSLFISYVYFKVIKL